jgi:predicted transcriptional regulator
MAYIWIKTTNDEYEFIVAMGDTAEKLAKECGTTERTIYSAISHAKKHGYKCAYKKVVVE